MSQAIVFAKVLALLRRGCPVEDVCILKKLTRSLARAAMSVRKPILRLRVSLSKRSEAHEQPNTNPVGGGLHKA